MIIASAIIIFQNCHHTWTIVVRYLSVFLANTIPQTAPAKALECLELWTWVLGIIYNDGANIKDRRHNNKHLCFVLLYFDTGSSCQAQAPFLKLERGWTMKLNNIVEMCIISKFWLRRWLMRTRAWNLRIHVKTRCSGAHL